MERKSEEKAGKACFFTQCSVNIIGSRVAVLSTKYQSAFNAACVF